MNVIWELLTAVKSEPEKYIGSPSLENLFFFLSGIIAYHWTYEGAGVLSLPGFRKYICYKYKDPGLDFGYMQIIRMNSENEKEAFYQFYELAEEFIENMGSKYIPYTGLKCSKIIKHDDLNCLWITLNDLYKKWNLYLGIKSFNGAWAGKKASSAAFPPAAHCTWLWNWRRKRKTEARPSWFCCLTPANGI